MNLNRQLGVVSIALVAAFGLACTSTTDPGASDLSRLASAQARWNAAELHDYSYDEVIGGSWFADSIHVDVRADTVFASYSYRNPVVRLQPTTISGMFAEIRAGIDAGTLGSASYDQRYGFPRRVTGSNHDLPDTGYAFGAVNVTPTPTS